MGKISKTGTAYESHTVHTRFHIGYTSVCTRTYIYYMRADTHTMHDDTHRYILYIPYQTPAYTQCVEKKKKIELYPRITEQNGKYTSRHNTRGLSVLYVIIPKVTEDA